MLGEITCKRIVGDENIICLTILGHSFGDNTVIREKCYARCFIGQMQNLNPV